MKNSYTVRVWDEAIYPAITANDKDEAMDVAWDYFNKRQPNFDVVKEADSLGNSIFEAKDNTKRTVMITSTYEANSDVNFVKLSKSNINFLEWLYSHGYLDSEIKYRIVENEIDF